MTTDTTAGATSATANSASSVIVNIEHVVDVAQEFIAEEPQIAALGAALASGIGPTAAALLPPPWNALASPIVLGALTALPKLGAVLTRVSPILAAIENAAKTLENVTNQASTATGGQAGTQTGQVVTIDLSANNSGQNASAPLSI